MLALTPLRSCNDESCRKGADYEMDFTIGDGIDDFSGVGNLLDDIDFDDLFVGMDYGDVLPDLEIDPEMLAEFSVSGGEESSDQLNLSSLSKYDEKLFVDEINNDGRRSEQEEEDRGSGSGSGSGSSLSREDETISKRDEDESIKVDNPISLSQNNKESSSRNRKSASGQTKSSSQGKRKVKVDWTPELHRRFVQAVEQLGMDKAVPSRILEIMGIDCLTRHNIASHLQKYRSHQKHLLAREAEAASWSQRRQIYGGVAAAARGSNKRPEHLNPWIAPTMGFPPPAANLLHPPYRPLHVWGHPTVDPSSLMNHVWPKYLHHSPSPPPPPHRWPPPPLPPPSDPSSYWHPNHHRVPTALPPGTPCFPPQALPTTRRPSSTSSSPAPPTVVSGIPPPPPHAMYKVDHGIGVATPGAGHSDLLHPTKERIDAAIEDVISKPWLPLPLGLKPPSIDSVMVELQLQGIPKIPPSSTSTTTTTNNTSTSTTA